MFGTPKVPMVEVIEFYEIWRIQDINFGSGKLTWKSRPWYLLDRLNSQGRVEKNSKGRFPVSSLFGVQPFLFRISGQVESKVLLQKERGRWNEVRKVVSHFLAIPILFQLITLYKEIPWRNSYVRNYTQFFSLGIHRRVFSDTPLKHSTGKKPWFENTSPILKKGCNLSSLEPTLFWQDISTRNQFLCKQLLFFKKKGPIGGPQFHQEGYPHFRHSNRTPRKWMDQSSVRY